MTNRLNRPEPTQVIEERRSTRPMPGLGDRLFQGWGPSI